MKPAKITVVGAGNVGASLAQRLIEKNIADVVMLDIIEGLPQGKALDIQQSAPTVGFTRYIKGTNNYEDTAASDIVVITSGIARKPGMSREDLIKINAGIVSGVVKNVMRYSPDCIIIMVANPVDAMTYLTVQVSGLPRERVIGLSGVLDSARLATFIALEMQVTVKEVTCYVLGEHGQNMVVLPRLARVNGKSITEVLPGETINRLIDRTVNGGAEIVGLLKTSSAFYAPSASIAKMALSIVGDKREVMPCSVCLNGEYGLKDVAIGVPVRLGRKGVMEIIDLRLTDDENRQLADSAGSVSKQISSLASIKGD